MALANLAKIYRTRIKVCLQHSVVVLLVMSRPTHQIEFHLVEIRRAHDHIQVAGLRKANVRQT